MKNLSPSERYCMRFLTLGLRPRFGMTLWKGAKVNRGRDYVPGFYVILAFARNNTIVILNGTQ